VRVGAHEERGAGREPDYFGVANGCLVGVEDAECCSYGHTVKLPASFVKFWVMFNLRVVQFEVKAEAGKKRQPVTVPAVLNPALSDCQVGDSSNLVQIY
jgi:hypothetical protein